MFQSCYSSFIILFLFYIKRASSQLLSLLCILYLFVFSYFPSSFILSLTHIIIFHFQNLNHSSFSFSFIYFLSIVFLISSLLPLSPIVCVVVFQIILLPFIRTINPKELLKFSYKNVGHWNQNSLN